MVVSVSITGVQLPDPTTAEVLLSDIAHAPLDAAALDRSVLILEGVGRPAAGFEDGYANWRRSLAAGESGFFTVTVAEIIGVYRRGLGRRAGPSPFDQSSPAT